MSKPVHIITGISDSADYRHEFSINNTLIETSRHNQLIIAY